MLNRRQFVKIAGAGVLGLGLVGCGNNAAQEAPNIEAAETSSTTEAATTAPEPTERKVAFVCSTDLTDHNTDLELGCAVEDAANELGWSTDYQYGLGSDEVEKTILGYIADGYGLICVPEYLGYIVEDVAPDNPNTVFCVFEGSAEGQNIMSISTDRTQVGQLGGSLAGLLTKTGFVEIVGQSHSLPSFQERADAFCDAARKVNPSIDTASYLDYAGKNENAVSQGANGILNAGYDVLFCDNPCVTCGAALALDSYDDCFAIGSIEDCGQYFGAKIACSVVIDYKGMVEQAMKSVEAGKYGNEVIEGNLANGFIKIGSFSSSVDASVQEKYLSIVDQIKAGTFM